MSKTSSAVRNRYSAKTYDRLQIVIKKTETPKVKARVEELGVSISEYVKSLIRQDIKDFEA